MAREQPATLAVRCTYRLLLRAIQRTSRCPVERPHLMQIVRMEFMCPEMAKEPHALDDALSILRNFAEREAAMQEHNRRSDASRRVDGDG